LFEKLLIKSFLRLSLLNELLYKLWAISSQSLHGIRRYHRAVSLHHDALRQALNPELLCDSLDPCIFPR